VEKSLTEAERAYGARKRDKWVYFSVLHGMCEVIMPLWYFYYYHLMTSSKIRDAFAGLKRDVHGAPIVRPNNLLTTCTILSCSEILDLAFFTFIVRQNFKSFNPFRILNRVVEKYNLLLAFSVMYAVLSVQCTFIIDCRFDLSSGGIYDAVGIRIF